MDVDMSWIVYIIAGLLSGVVAGMGMGGGTILIPALTLLIGMGQHAAQGVNMIAFIPGAIIALVVHAKAGRLNVKSCIPIMILGAAGAVAGALVANSLEADWLKRAYGVFLIGLSVIQFISGEKNKSKKNNSTNSQ